MSTNDEQHRLRYFRHGEMPPELHTTITIECVNRDDCISKLFSVMELIVEHDSAHWPDDNYWRMRLPEWLLGTFKTYTPQELAEIRSDRSRWANLAWTFGSWVDRMRDRDWHWWSLELRGDQSMRVHVVVEGYPYTTKALEHLITAAGGRLV